MSDNSSSSSGGCGAPSIVSLLGVLAIILKLCNLEPFPQWFLLADIDWWVLLVMVFSGIIFSFFIITTILFVGGFIYTLAVAFGAFINVLLNGR